MSKCPFWSTTKKKVECHDTCPMNEVAKEESDCVFKAHLQLNKMSFKDIAENDIAYSQDTVFKLEFIDEPSVYK